MSGYEDSPHQLPINSCGYSGDRSVTILTGSYAERKCDDFKREQEALKKLLPEETRDIVKAICEANEDARQDAANDAKNRVQSEVRSKFENLSKMREEADKYLDEVLKDESLKDKQDKAKEYKSDLETRWKTVEKMDKGLRGSNHPVVSFMIEEGKKAHKDYQGSSSYCTLAEFEMNGGRADCMIAAGSTCYVVELKPDNSKAIDKGEEQSDRYANELNNNAETRKKLVDKDSRFKDCQKFEPRVDCYKLCPEIDSENDFKSTYAVWRSRCT